MWNNHFISTWFEIASWHIWGGGTLFASLTVVTVLLFKKRRQNSATAHKIVELASEAVCLPLVDQIRPQLSQELGRARRYERPLTAVVLNFECDRLLDSSESVSVPAETQRYDLQFVALTQFTFFLTGLLLRSALRASDIIAYDAIHTEYILLLPESNKSQGLQAVSRLQKLLSNQVQVQSHAGIAEFPTDALTVDDLINHARAMCHFQ